MPSKYPAYGRGSRAKVCRECGRHRDEVAYISARALCDRCGCERSDANIRQAVDRQGPHYDAWRRGYIEFALALTRQD